jgi:hypothetical protein
VGTGLFFNPDLQQFKLKGGQIRGQVHFTSNLFETYLFKSLQNMALDVVKPLSPLFVFERSFFVWREKQIITRFSGK